MDKIIIGSLILIIIYSHFLNNNEGFQIVKPKTIKLPPFHDAPMHAKLNDFNGVDYVDDKPPCARGEYGCRKVTCPSENNIICWRCADIISQPEYEGPDEIYSGRHY
jgi:hypothetical protein